MNCQGRLEGGEAGIATAVDSQLTDPDVAEHFVNETGVQILAPCMHVFRCGVWTGIDLVAVETATAAMSKSRTSGKSSC
jgi:hypothetical protein